MEVSATLLAYHIAYSSIKKGYTRNVWDGWLEYVLVLGNPLRFSSEHEMLYTLRRSTKPRRELVRFSTLSHLLFSHGSFIACQLYDLRYFLPVP